MTKQDYYRKWFDGKRKFIMETQECHAEGISALEIIAQIFRVTTYDSDMDCHFARIILPVMLAIARGKAFDYHEQSQQHYVDFLMVCNFTAIEPLLSWGTSIRGAWFSAPKEGFRPDLGIGYYSEEKPMVIADRDDFLAFMEMLDAAVKEEEGPIELPVLAEYDNDPAALKQVLLAKLITDVNNSIATQMEDQVIESIEQAEDFITQAVEKVLNPLIAGGMKPTWKMIRQEPTTAQPRWGWLITVTSEHGEGTITLA